MAHLIRSVSGTNRNPIYGPWHVCEICPDNPDIPGEAESLQKIIDSVDQFPGMSLAEFWKAYSDKTIALATRAE